MEWRKESGARDWGSPPSRLGVAREGVGAIREEKDYNLNILFELLTRIGKN